MKGTRAIVEATRGFSRPFSVTSRIYNASAQSKAKPAPIIENTSFAMNLFRGQLQPSQIFPYPYLLDEDQWETVTALVDPVERFFAEVNDPLKNDANESVDENTMKELWELGLFGLRLPTDYGGLGLTNTQYTRLVEIGGANDLAVSVMLGVHQGIGSKGILLYGTLEQKAKYLPRVSTGRQLAAFCLTEPSSGSDAGSIRCRAVLSPDGKHYILNGSKIWITNGGMAEVMTVFAQTPVEKDGKIVDKVTAFIVEKAFEGVSTGLPEHKMGIKCSNTAEVFFEETKIPVENVLGGLGDGFKIAMNVLNNGRFAIAGLLAGTMRTCVRKATEHATTRLQFGKHIDSYGTIQEKLARMQILQYVTESMAYMISANVDSGIMDFHLEAAIAKVFASEAAWSVCDEAIQILGGMGYMKATGLEKILRDIRIFRIFEGTSEILRLFIALTGIQYAGSHLREIQKAFKNPSANLGLIFSEAGRRAIRSAGLYSGPEMTHLVASPLQSSAQQVSKSVDEFGQAVEACLIKYGKGIVEQQFVLNRLAQSAIDTYTMAVVLSRASRALSTGLPSAAQEQRMAEAWCIEASERVARNLKAMSSKNDLELYGKLETIAKNMCENGGCVQRNPLNI